MGAKNENEKTTVIRFDTTCTVLLTLADDRVTVIKYNDIDGSEKRLSGKLKEIKNG